MAYERLRIEQEEQRKANQAKESTTVEQGARTLECRNWFEQRESQSSSKSQNPSQSLSHRSRATFRLQKTRRHREDVIEK